MIYTRNYYPDGGMYAEISDFSNPIITERINSYEDLFFIKSLKDICDYNNIEGVELFIPCLFQQQHDRRFKDNQSFEGRLVADFINSCNFSKVYVFHPHSDVIIGMINKCHVMSNHSFINWVLNDINNSDNLILMSADAGGFKPLIKLAEVIEWQNETYSASKARDPLNIPYLKRKWDKIDLNIKFKCNFFEERKDEIISLYKQGNNIHQISKILNINYNSLMNNKLKIYNNIV